MNHGAPPVVAIFGPTASGKSALVEALLAHLPDAEAVSADSAAIYAGLPIITAAPNHPAHLVGTVPLTDDVSVAEYQRSAHATIDAILDRGNTPIVVGGTGLYFRAALSALTFPPAPSDELRARWNSHYDENGGDATYALLAERDPRAASRIHANDRRRVVRALELTELGSSLAPEGENRLWTDDMRRPTILITLDGPAEMLDARIAQRAHEMAAAGAGDEAKRAWAEPLSDTARKILGLEQFATLAEGEAIDAVALATRQLARYQRKWLRRLPSAATLEFTRSLEELSDAVVSLAGSRKYLSRG